MKYLGIDYGTKRIGLAVSDDSATLAFPLQVLATSKDSAGEIVELAKEQKIDQIILGESRNFHDEPNTIMGEVNKLKSALEAAGYPVIYEPEFMTSAMAARSEGVSREQLDASAAAIILQSYLDRTKIEE